MLLDECFCVRSCFTLALASLHAQNSHFLCAICWQQKGKSSLTLTLSHSFVGAKKVTHTHTDKKVRNKSASTLNNCVCVLALMPVE